MDISIRTDALSYDDFERFANMIVERRFDLRIHGFAEGRDDGVDGVDEITNPKIIVQSKRWNLQMNRNQTIKKLKAEIDKIKNSTSNKYGWQVGFHYVIVTSLGLTPANRAEIRNYAGKLIPNDDYLIDAVELDKLSKCDSFKDIYKEFRLIERDLIDFVRVESQKNFELGSSDYFSKFDFKYFVETDAFHESYHVLQEKHVLLLQGNPGVGKTTTCAMLGNLFANFLDNKFTVIEKTIDEVEAVREMYNRDYRDKDKNLLVIFDDFLGRNVYDKEEVQLKKVDRLFSTANNSENLFVILNSRTYILNNAIISNLEFKGLIEKITKNDEEVIIDLSKYSEIDKAKILRKNIEKEYSKLEESKKDSLAEKYESIRKQENYNNIVRHPNYNPRLIEYISTHFEESEDDFFDFILGKLKNPSDLYDEVFSTLSNEQKYLLASLYLFQEFPVKESVLKDSFHVLNLNAVFDFFEEEKKLEKSWLSFSIRDTVSGKLVDFANPSIVDYLTNKLNGLTIKEDILSKSIYAQQFLKNVNEGEFYRYIINSWNRIADRDDFIGEYLTSVVKCGRYSNNRKEFEELLFSYDGTSKLKKSASGWRILVESINSSDDVKLKSWFADTLLNQMSSNKRLFTQILESKKVDLDELDDIAVALDEIIREVYGEGLEQNEIIDFAEEKTGSNIYAELCYRKHELLQEWIEALDSYEIDELIEESDVEETSENDDNIVRGVVDHFEDEIADKIRLSNFDYEEGIDDNFDYSNIESYAESRIEDIRESFGEDGDDYDDYESWWDRQNENEETVSSILDRPLD